MYIVGITGGTGSGKTTIANTVIKDATKNITLLNQDAYYKNYNINKKEINFDHPDAIDFNLLVQHLKLLKSGKSIKQPIYNFSTHTRSEDYTLKTPNKIIILEGILILSNPEVKSLIDLSFFIEADADIRLIRRIKRDTKARGRDVNQIMQQYTNTIKPMHMEHIEPVKKYADIILLNNNYNTNASSIINSILKEKL